jgi:hypothetical protein
MYYICIENEFVISVLDYLPEVPLTVSVVEITKEEFDGLTTGKKQFDIETKTIIDSIIDSSLEEKLNFLRSTDWMVLRHIREKSLELTTTLTEEEYLNLESKRQNVAMSI